jgi:hypothetical protein
VPVTGAHPRAVSCETTAWERPAKDLCLLSRGPRAKPCAEGERRGSIHKRRPPASPLGRGRGADNSIDARIGRPNRHPRQTIQPNNNARKIILARPSSGARQPPDQGVGDIVRNTIGLPRYREHQIVNWQRGSEERRRRSTNLLATRRRTPSVAR